MPLHFLEIVQLTIPSVFFLTVKRAAVMSEKNLVKDYVTKVVPKADTVKKLIYNAIKGNTLFKACSEEE